MGGGGGKSSKQEKRTRKVFLACRGSKAENGKKKKPKEGIVKREKAHSDGNIERKKIVFDRGKGFFSSTDPGGAWCLAEGRKIPYKATR